MFYADIKKYVKLATIVLVFVTVTGCGGGRATTSSTDTGTGSGSGTGTGTGTGTQTPPSLPPALTSAELNWLPPTTNTDNSPLINLAGHNIYINDGSGFKKLTSITNPSVTAYVVENLEAGTYTFTVTAFDSNGVESAYSNEAKITI